MKFTKTEREIRIPWKDDAILIFKAPLITDIMKDQPELIQAIQKKQEEGFDLIAVKLAQIYLKDSENIVVGDNNEKLEMTEENKIQIINQVLLEPEMIEKIILALLGPVQNLINGLTASLTTDGNREHVTDVKMKSQNS